MSEGGTNYAGFIFLVIVTIIGMFTGYVLGHDTSPYCVNGGTTSSHQLSYYENGSLASNYTVDGLISFCNFDTIQITEEELKELNGVFDMEDAE